MKSLKNFEKVSGRFACAVYSNAAFPALKAVHVGCLFAWSKLALESGQAGIPRRELRAYGAYFAGMDEAGFEQLLNELVAMSLVTIDADGNVELVHLAGAMQSKNAETDRRKAGWQQRREQAQGSRPAPRAPTQTATTSVAPLGETDVPMQASMLESDSAPRVGITELEPAKRPAPVNPLLIDAGDDDQSPVIMRLEVKGDRVVEFTEAFAKSMEPLYSGVDVHREMLRAAEWCRGKPERRKTVKGARSFVTGWLSRSAQRHEVTIAVVASGNQRNGFGQGGRYGTETTPTAAAGNDGLDDFADFFVEPKAKTNRGLFSDEAPGASSLQ
jgi:hypothetical protein